MTQKKPAFLFFPDNWFGGTLTMTPIQRAAYIDLICLQWLHGSFTAEMARQVLRGIPEADLQAVLASKFVLEGGRYFNSRLECERGRQGDRTNRAKEAAKKRWEKPAKDANSCLDDAKDHARGYAKHDARGYAKDDACAMPSSSSSSSIVQGQDSISLKGVELPKLFAESQEFKNVFEDWLRWNFAKTGTRLDAITISYQLQDLHRRGLAKSIADLQLTMSKAAKPSGIWDSDMNKNGSASRKKQLFGGEQ
jgi:uncharacterized protein YdaU (DUF1376 family)